MNGNQHGLVSRTRFWPRLSRASSACRSGSSLVETAVAVTVSATLLLVAVGWIHQSLKLASLMKQRQSQHQQLMNLASQFRSDVHLAESVSLEQDRRLVLRLNSKEQVTYQVSDHKITRQSRSLSTADGVLNEVTPDATSPDVASDELSPAAMQHHERYTLTPGSVAQWDDSQSPSWITLRVYRSRPDSVKSRSLAGRPDSSSVGQVVSQPQHDRSAIQNSDPPPLDLHVRAAVGRWRVDSPVKADNE